MRLEMVLLAGAETKQFLASLTKQLDRMESLQNGGTTHAETETEETEVEETEDDGDFAPAIKTAAKKTAATTFDDEDEDEAETPPVIVKNKKAAASFDDEDESDVTAGEDDAPVVATKKKKAKGPTLDDVNAACLAHATKTNRATTVALLKKHYGVKSVTNLKPEQYEAVIATLKKGK